MCKVWEEVASLGVAEQDLDKAGDDFVFVLHQPPDEDYQGRPRCGCG